MLSVYQVLQKMSTLNRRLNRSTLYLIMVMLVAIFAAVLWALDIYMRVAKIILDYISLGID